MLINVVVATQTEEFTVFMLKYLTSLMLQPSPGFLPVKSHFFVHQIQFDAVFLGMQKKNYNAYHVCEHGCVLFKLR